MGVYDDIERARQSAAQGDFVVAKTAADVIGSIAGEQDRRIRQAQAQALFEGGGGHVQFEMGSYLKSLIIAPLVVGGLMGGGTLLFGGPFLEVGLIAGGAAFALLAVIGLIVAVFTGLAYLLGGLVYLVGAMIGFVFSLWRWGLAVGVLGAGVGFVLATMESRSSDAVMQSVLEAGGIGVASGLTLGVLMRLLRGMLKAVLRIARRRS